MKASITFDLPEEHAELEDFINQHRYQLCLLDVCRMLRRKQRYENEPHDMDLIYKELFTIINNNQLTRDMIGF